MMAAMKSSKKESQRDPEWNSVKWLELMSFSVLNLKRDTDRNERVLTAPVKKNALVRA